LWSESRDAVALCWQFYGRLYEQPIPCYEINIYRFAKLDIFLKEIEINMDIGRAITQAFFFAERSHWRSVFNPTPVLELFIVEKSGAATGFDPEFFGFPPCHYHSINTPRSAIYLSLKLNNLNNRRHEINHFKKKCVSDLSL
jgi:hypothetical protein